nr:unnamed protein product [Digitaria exilis]
MGDEDNGGDIGLVRWSSTLVQRSDCVGTRNPVVVDWWCCHQLDRRVDQPEPTSQTIRMPRLLAAAGRVHSLCCRSSSGGDSMNAASEALGPSWKEGKLRGLKADH